MAGVPVLLSKVDLKSIKFELAKLLLVPLLRTCNIPVNPLEHMQPVMI